jgi:hypothetical protein
VHAVRDLVPLRDPERVEVKRRDGTSTALRLAAGGRLPAHVGVPATTPSNALDVYLSEAVLRDLTIIDTPGLASLHDTNSDRTRTSSAVPPPQPLAPKPFSSSSPSA